MTKCINKIWSENGLLEVWKNGVIKPIYKKDYIDKMEDYRGITLMDTGYKYMLNG